MANINITYPLSDDKNGNFFLKRNENTIDAIKSNLFLLFTTEKGDRFYDRGYGSNLRRFLFEQNDELTTLDIETDVKATVSKYMPAITINMVKTESTNDEKNIEVTMFFTYKDDFYSFSDVIRIIF